MEQRRINVLEYDRARGGVDRHSTVQAQEYSRRYKAEHPEWNRQKRREYYKRYTETVKRRSRQDVNNRRARLAGAPGVITIEEFWAKCEESGWLCQYCRKVLTKRTATIDHIIPLGATGSTNYMSNIAPCCRPCNARKGNRLYDDIDLYAATPISQAGSSGLCR